MNIGNERLSSVGAVPEQQEPEQQEPEQQEPEQQEPEQQEPEQRVNGPGALLFALLLLAVGLTAALTSLDIAGRAAVWPRILAGLLLVAAAWEVVSQARRLSRRDRAAAGAGLRGRLRSRLREREVRVRLLVSAWLVAFVALGVTVGLGWSMLIFFPVYQWFGGKRSIVRVALTTTALLIAVQLLFGQLASVPLW